MRTKEYYEFLNHFIFDVTAGFKRQYRGRCMRILIVLDDLSAASELLRGLVTSGFSVDHAKSSEQGSFWARTTDYDLVIIEHTDSTDAVVLCKQLRAKGKTMPIVIMARCQRPDKVSLLNAGADDCVTIDCSRAELTARVRAVLRRPKSLIGDVIKIDDLTIDTVRYLVMRGNKSISLTRKEFGLLEYLLRNKEAVISRTALIEHVWDINADLFSNTLETHILNLRRKIEAKGKPKLIHTISGRGYKIALLP